MDVDVAIGKAATQLGYVEVREEQREAIRGILEKDVFVALPTGYGKSLCYALLPAVFDMVYGRPPNTSIVLCVSPLRSLMLDQTKQFSAKGLSVDYVGSSEEQAHERIRQGLCQLVYMSPETLLCNLHWRELLRTEVWQRNLVTLVVDEAHCIPKW